MARTAADDLVRVLADWGVDTIFGMPGDGINGLMEALRQQQGAIRFIQVRHEEAAAFMACGHAKWTGRLGVCLATSGPGGIHLLNGLYDAKLDQAPVLAITGLQHHDLIGTRTQQDVELDKLFADACVYNARVMGPGHAARVADRACRDALAQRGVSHITFPVDLQSQPGASESAGRMAPAGMTHLGRGDAQRPAEEELTRAAEILNRGEKVCILAGQGALGAPHELTAVAERLGAPVAKALLGKGALPDTNPYNVGGVGLLGTRPGQEALESCDTLFIVGSSFPYLEYYPARDQARAVQLDIDPSRIGLRYPVDAALIGDTAEALGHLLPRLRHKPERGFLARAQEDYRDWQLQMAGLGTREDVPMKPQVVAHELNKRLTSDAIVATDSGTVTTWAARHLDIRDGMQFSCSGTLASMACGLPYAAAGALAYPDRQAIAFLGDGGFTMLMGELATCRKYQLDVKIIVLKNNSLAQIKWEQLVFLGNPEYGCELEDIDFAAIARGFGIPGFRVEDPTRCGDILSEALATTGPALVEAVVDPHEPPLPPSISLKQSGRFAQSLIRGTPHAGKIALTAASARVRELI